MSNHPSKPKEPTTPPGNFWHFLWLFWMQPILLHQKLIAKKIQPNESATHLWTAKGQQRKYIFYLFLINCISLLIGIASLILGSLLQIPTNWTTGILGAILGIIIGISALLTFGTAFGASIGGVLIAILPPTMGFYSSKELGIILPPASGISYGIGVGSAFGIILDVAFGLTYGQAIAKERFFSRAMPLAFFSGVGSSIGAVWSGITHSLIHLIDGAQTIIYVGLSIILSLAITSFRIPIALAEFIISIIIFLPKSNGKYLKYSPVNHHDLSYLKIPFLGRHILATAPHDPELAERALRACLRSPGQQSHARWVLAQWEAQQLTDLALNDQFFQITELQGRWLPQAEAAGPGTLLLRDVARQVLASDHASTPHHRLRYLNDAQALLERLPNTLTSETPERAEALAPVQAVFQRKLTERLTAAQAEAANLLPNPFLTQPLNPEDGAELFLGRDALIRQLEAILADPAQRNSIALLGPRRCGKSSLLRMLPLKLPDAVPIFFDLQDNPSGSPAQFYAAIASRVAEQARRERQMDKLPKLPPAADLAAFAAWLEQLDAALGGRRLLLCIDEFERLEQLFPDDQRGLLQFMGLLRATVQHRRNIRLLVAGVAPFDELSTDLWSDHFINLRELRVEHLDEATAVQLLTRPIPELTAITPEVARAVFQRTGGQPLLLQLYGSMLVDRLNAEQRTNTTADDLAAVDAQVLDGGNAANHFRNLYEVAPPEAKSVLLDMAQGQTPELSPATRRYLLRRCLITREGAPGIPVFLDWVRAEC